MNNAMCYNDFNEGASKMKLNYKNKDIQACINLLTSGEIPSANEYYLKTVQGIPSMDCLHEVSAALNDVYGMRMNVPKGLKADKLQKELQR